MRIAAITRVLEELASPGLQENYDNAGLLTGHRDWECTGILCALDATEEVIEEAISKNCNLVVAHHPILFGGIKKINGYTYVERALIRAIKNDVAIYAIHTNLDNVLHGVSGRMGKLLGLMNTTVLLPKPQTLRKLHTFVPAAAAPAVLDALFNAGAGHIGNYDECSFNLEGVGTFRAGDGTTPYVGKHGERHQEKETRMEVIYPVVKEAQVLAALKAAHPYEEVAYDLVPLANVHPGIGSGVVGDLPVELDIPAFLALLKSTFGTPVIRYAETGAKTVKRVALCGGAGSFLISKALQSGADAYVTADLKYHEFFDAEGSMLLADIGHYESEQFTVALLQEVLAEKFPTFAVLKTAIITNPVHYS